MEKEESLKKVSRVVIRGLARRLIPPWPCRHAQVRHVAKHGEGKRPDYQPGRSWPEQQVRNGHGMDISLPPERPLDLHPQIQSVSIASQAALQRPSSGYSSSSDPLAVFGLPAFAI